MLYSDAQIDTNYYLYSALAVDDDPIVNSNITDSTSPTTGALVLAGGAGIAKNVSVGGQLSAASTTDSSSVSTGSVKVAGGVGIAKSLYTGTATNLAVTSGVTSIGSSTPVSVSASGVLEVTNVSDSSSISTGSIKTSGGAGVAKSLYVGTGVNLATVSGSTNIGSSTPATFTAAGVLTVNNTTSVASSNLSIGGAINIAGDISLTNSTKSVLSFARGSVAGAPTFNTRSDGTRLILFPNIGAATTDAAFGLESDGTWFSSSDATKRFYWYAGTTKIATLFGNGDFNVAGALSKGSGSFDIEHPLFPEKRLVHSFVEGPRCDNIYRGVVKLKDGQAVVNLDKECVAKGECAMTEGTFEALCQNPQVFLQSSEFDKVIGAVEGNKLHIKSQTTTEASISWMVVAERKDAFIKTWDKTTEEGFLVTEYTK